MRSRPGRSSCATAGPAGGRARDGLAERGALGSRAQALVESGAVTALAPFLIDRIAAEGDALAITGRQEDRIIVAAGCRKR